MQSSAVQKVSLAKKYWRRGKLVATRVVDFPRSTGTNMTGHSGHMLSRPIDACTLVYLAKLNFRFSGVSL